MKPFTLILALLAAGCSAAPVNLTCDPCPGAASYTVYVVTASATNTVSYSSNVFNGVDVPAKAYAAVTQTDTNGFESDWSNCLTNSATKPANLRKK